MIEWLKDNRVLLYKSEFIRSEKTDGDKKNLVQDIDYEKPNLEWKFLKRMRFMDS